MSGQSRPRPLGEEFDILYPLGRNFMQGTQSLPGIGAEPGHAALNMLATVVRIGVEVESASMHDAGKFRTAVQTKAAEFKESRPVQN